MTSRRLFSSLKFESDRPEPNVKRPHKIINQVSCLFLREYRIHMNRGFFRVRKTFCLLLADCWCLCLCWAHFSELVTSIVASNNGNKSCRAKQLQFFPLLFQPWMFTFIICVDNPLWNRLADDITNNIFSSQFLVNFYCWPKLFDWNAMIEFRFEAKLREKKMFRIWMILWLVVACDWVFSVLACIIW